MNNTNINVHNLVSLCTKKSSLCKEVKFNSIQVKKLRFYHLEFPFGIMTVGRKRDSALGLHFKVGIKHAFIPPIHLGIPASPPSALLPSAWIPSGFFSGEGPIRIPPTNRC